LKKNKEEKTLLIINSIFFSNDLNLNLQIWDTEYNRSFYKKKFLLKTERDIINITRYNRNIIIGIVLSDGFIEKRVGWNPRIRFEYSVKSFEYIWFIFNQLSNLINEYPLLLRRTLRNKIFYSLTFKTRQLQCLSEIHNLFYKGRRKYISSDLYDYFDSIVLAHWIMGDGSKSGKGIVICTDSYTIEEVVLLMNILKIKFNVDSTITYHTLYAPLDILKLNIKKLHEYVLTE
jgi:LAGLIDADG DNA endonuclease family